MNNGVSQSHSVRPPPLFQLVGHNQGNNNIHNRTAFSRLSSSSLSPSPSNSSSSLSPNNNNNNQNSLYRSMQSDSFMNSSSSVNTISLISLEKQLKLSTSVEMRGPDDPPLEDVLVDEVEAREYQCGICMQIMVNPRQCKNGHLFCGVCIHKSIEKRPECPQCRDYLNLAELSRSLLAEKAIRNLKVHCKFNLMKGGKRGGEDVWIEDPEGCPEIRTQEEIQKHESSCGYAPEACIYGANCQVRKMQMEDHKSTCPFRPVICKFCSRRVTFNQLENHVAKCDEVVVSCQSCHEEMKRGKVQSHRMEECPEEFLQCPFAKQGCDAKLRRRDFEQHTSVNMANHLILMHQYYEERMSLMMAETRRLIATKDEQIRNLERATFNPIEFVWTVKDWSNRSKQFFIKSRTFEMANAEWYIGIYPNGLDEQTPSKFIAIMLFMNLEVATRNKNIAVKSIFRLLNHKNMNETVEKDPGVKSFPIDMGPEADEDQDKGYGSARFILSSKLSEEEGFLKDDALTVQLFVTKCLVKWDLVTSTPDKVGWL
eukprot:TRINITY_DN4238_c0_g1_i2.p1 TRINITY_DN4238_c0_g1~~TRINITY_DN4238_c0_g1_i2.p1  ORF type:complete len:540 (-),score=177.25 TRINITY_DN4238_c0_g1_i2:250-1869(-)